MFFMLSIHSVHIYIQAFLAIRITYSAEKALKSQKLS